MVNKDCSSVKTEDKTTSLSQKPVTRSPSPLAMGKAIRSSWHLPWGRTLVRDQTKQLN